MDVGMALDLGREALLVAMVICAPILIIGVVVGVIISLLQAVTQVHDQTFSLVPKIVAMLGAAVLFAPWIWNRLLEYTQTAFGGG